MGEGHFMDDEEELDSDKDDGTNVAPQPVDDDEENQDDLFRVFYDRRRGSVAGSESTSKDGNSDDYDPEAFLEQMMVDLRKTAEDMTEAEIKRQREEKEAALKKEKDMEESKFADNNFWALPRDNVDNDVDALLAELEDDEYT